MKTLGTLSHTHLDILYAKTHCGLRRINCAAGLAQFGSVWLTLPLPRVAMPPGHAGINARKTARYTGKECAKRWLMPKKNSFGAGLSCLVNPIRLASVQYRSWSTYALSRISDIDL